MNKRPDYKLNPHSIYINDILYHEIKDLPIKGKSSFSQKASYVLNDYVKRIVKHGHPAKLSGNGELRFIDLFAGVGGIRLGFTNYEKDAKTKCVFASEWDKFAKKTYKANFGVVPAGDITKIHADQIPNFDVLLAGFPCQPFSSIGQRQGFANKTQGTLFFDVLRILKFHKPEAFILENVPGLLTIQHGKTFAIIKGALIEAGYRVSYKVLQAADFGLAQSRKRVIIVGFRNDIDSSEFAFPTHNDLPRRYVKDILQKRSPKGYSISKRLQKHYLFKKDDGHPYVVDRHTKALAKTLNASYHKIQRVTGTFVKGGSTGLRLLSKIECERLQGFPSWFRIPVSRTQMYRQMGNAVAIPMIQAVANNLKAVLRKESPAKQHKNAKEEQESLKL